MVCAVAMSMLRASLCFGMIAPILGTFQIARHVDSLQYPSTTLDITGPAAQNRTKVCMKTDKYGSDACVLAWSETYQLHLKGTMPAMTEISEADYLQVSGKLADTFPFELACHACGKPCFFELPPPWRTKISFDTPDCPIYQSTFDHVFNVTMPASPGYDLWFRGFVSLGSLANTPKAKLEVEIVLGRK